MNALQRKALVTVPLSSQTVESFWDGSHSGTPEQCLRALCASHERLRAELEGAEALLKEPDPEIARLKVKLAAALALTDTGSREFIAAFPPKCVGAAFFPKEIVPGWRVVEKIREVLS